MKTATLLPNYRPRAGRRPPPELVAQLREVDPTAELIYAGRGKWILGTVQPNRIRERKANNMLATLLGIQGVVNLGHADVVPAKVRATIAYRLWYYELVRQGFRTIQAYNFQGIPTSHIASDFRKRDWLYRHHFEAELKAYEAAADQETKQDAAIKKLRNYLNEEVGSIHRHAFRRPIISVPTKPARGQKVIQHHSTRRA